MKNQTAVSQPINTPISEQKSTGHQDKKYIAIASQPVQKTLFWKTRFWKTSLQVLPTAGAIIPVSLLFGVLASQADWSVTEVFLISSLGFTGSGQFALLPLTESGTGLLTLLLLAVSINSRYLAIALVSASRLPGAPVKKALAAHMLGDEAYALETEQTSATTTLLIRSILFICWILSAVIGVWLAPYIPSEWLAEEINPGYPASAVLFFLSVNQLKVRLQSQFKMSDAHDERTPRKVKPSEQSSSCNLIRLIAGILISGVCILVLGSEYFWLPAIAIVSVFRLRRTA
ncbi:AzlC family ABC transporter permease [Oceanospirillum sediminis]|uniref:AzlC family ABC transporter permease n=1 Tax=Oceanospirillum sediminis TaxID=2760088 RepID=A0A839IPF5_9GAMM|nr:AzlC family ABC transporter permease [Oceanospirillum sediminis]MBB1487135.1 AzlC family ABC transporter permease [Oceanospirillum sediminis]